MLYGKGQDRFCWIVNIKRYTDRDKKIYSLRVSKTNARFVATTNPVTMPLKDSLSVLGGLASREEGPVPADVRNGSLCPKVKFNGDLNGYHFPYFNGHFICREQLPSGSETFQQVLDEINDRFDDLNVSDQPKRLPVNNRRKSVSTMTRASILKDDFHTNTNTKSERTRRISWGKPVYLCSETAMPVMSYIRPRVCSDGAVIRRKSLLSRRQ